jgi:heme exporter protein B
LLAAVKGTDLMMEGDPMDQLTSWVALLACFDLMYWSVCGVLFPRVIDA